MARTMRPVGTQISAGRCLNGPSDQSETAFKDIAKSYNVFIVNANSHPQVVCRKKGLAYRLTAIARG
ncbi:hypothetical protein HDV63DRAFT_368758 [Trichoderma sp. SZMC 28014]